jgi:hypothetical protein
MNDEQKRVVKLLREYDGIETGFERKRNELEAAELITHILDEFDRAIAENERIRQTHVTHEAYKMVLDELEHAKKERDAAVKDIEAVITHYTCYVCKHSQSGHGYGCDIATDLKDKLWDCAEHHRFEWRGVCAENESETQ